MKQGRTVRNTQAVIGSVTVSKSRRMYVRKDVGRSLSVPRRRPSHLLDSGLQRLHITTVLLGLIFFFDDKWVFWQPLTMLQIIVMQQMLSCLLGTEPTARGSFSKKLLQAMHHSDGYHFTAITATHGAIILFSR